MFSQEEIQRLYELKEQRVQEEYEREREVKKHLAFYRWLVAHGRMKEDLSADRSFPSRKENV